MKQTHIGQDINIEYYTIEDNEMLWIDFGNNLQVSNLTCGDNACFCISGVPLYGIYVAYKAEFDSIRFISFRVAIRWTRDYADMKKITRCNFDEMLVSENEDDYIVDFGTLGDALIFEGNAIHGGGNHRGVSVNTCNSGIITSNIINADVKIRWTKGLSFSNNHMELGPQIVIDQSDVTLSNNFIMKGVRPSIMIKNEGWGGNCAVNMNNNQYLYYSSKGRDYIIQSRNRNKDWVCQE